LVGRLVLEKAPLFLLTGAAAVLAYVAQVRGGGVRPVEPFPFPTRLLNVLFSYGWYLAKTVWPSNLAAFYPHPGSAISAWALAAAAAVLVALSVVCLRAVRSRPFAIVGWLWYLGTLVPVIGLVQHGDMGRADRFSYLPSVGVAIMIAWSAASWAGDRPWRAHIVRAGSGFALVMLTALSFRQAGFWRDGVTLFSHAVAVTGVNSLARYNLALSLASAGRIADAERELERTVADDPGYLPAYHDLSELAEQQGRRREAFAYLAAGLARAPRSPRLNYDLGILLKRSEERRVGKECRRLCRSRWSPYH
jgi:tetratricopeptide (TPR) repeat protein